MLHFLSPPAELPENMAPPPRQRAVQALHRHVILWPFRVTSEDAAAAPTEGLSDQSGMPACDHVFVS